MGSTCHAWRPTALQQKQLVVILNFVICLWLFQEKDAPGGWGGGLLPTMAYTGTLHLKGIPFSGFRYMKG